MEEATETLERSSRSRIAEAIATGGGRGKGKEMVGWDADGDFNN